MNLNMQMIRKIHAGADGTCYSAILRAWELDDQVYSKKNWNIKVKIHKLKVDHNYTDEQIAEEIGVKQGSIKKHLKQYDQIMKRIWFPEDINDEMFDRMYTTNSFYKKCDELIDREVEDAYFSLNSFWRTKKSTIDVRHINAFVLDFDFYKLSQYKDLSPGEFYKRKIKNKLPLEPTAVVDSGRGLYVIYSFKHCSYHMDRLYKTIMEWFYKKFEGYGMDNLALNTTQVIRLPGTLNTKTLRLVHVLHYKDTQYTIQDFAKLLPFDYDAVLQHKKLKNKDQKETKGTIDPKLLEAKKIVKKTYFKEFLTDIKRLITIRNRSGTYEGYREMLIYIVRERATWSGYDINESIELAKDCNQCFHLPLGEKAIINQCKPSGGRKKSSIDTIIDKLAINIDEQLEMRVLKRKWLKKAHYAKRKRKHSLLNMTSKDYEQLQRRTKVCELKNKKHLKNAKIADLLKVDKSTITRDVKYIKGHPAEFKITLEEYMNELEDKRHTVLFNRLLPYEEQKQLLEWLKTGYTALEFLVRKMGVAEN